MNRIERCFKNCHDQGHKALVIYICAGDPDLEFTEELVPQLVAAGADIIEIGVPFSDPMADGPTIQAAGQRALAAGTTLRKIVDMLPRIRAKCPDTPLVIFSYYNVLLQYGEEQLMEACVKAGVDGWLVVDQPFQENGEMARKLNNRQLCKIELLAPTSTPERRKSLLSKAGGFVYCITVKGVTGVRSELPPEVAGYLETIRHETELPLVAGFGVSSPEMAAALGEHVDGVVVGSKVVQTIANAPDRETAKCGACEFVSSLAKALH